MALCNLPCSEKKYKEIKTIVNNIIRGLPISSKVLIDMDIGETLESYRTYQVKLLKDSKFSFKHILEGAEKSVRECVILMYLAGVNVLSE